MAHSLRESLDLQSILQTSRWWGGSGGSEGVEGYETEVGKRVTGLRMRRKQGWGKPMKVAWLG